MTQPVRKDSISPAAAPPKPSQPEENQSVKVAQAALAAPKPNIFQRMRNQVFEWGADFFLPYTKTIDEQVLTAIVGPHQNLTEQLKEKAPHIYDIVKKMIPYKSVQNWAKNDPQYVQTKIDEAILHIIANLAKGEEPGITLDELTVRITKKLVPLIGNALNSVDKQIADGTKNQSELFEPVMQELFNMIIPPGDRHRKFYEMIDVTKLGAAALSDQYGQIMENKPAVKKSEESEEVDLTQMKSDLKEFGSFFSKALTHHYRPEDEKFFRELTGSEDVNALVKHFSPQLQQFIPQHFKDLLDQDALETLMLHALVCMSKEVFPEQIKNGKQVPIENLVKEVSTHFIGYFRNATDQIKRQPNREQEIIRDLSTQVLKLFVPKEPWLLDFIERRKDKYLTGISEKVSVYCKPFLEKIEVSADLVDRKQTVEYKNRLKAVLGDTNPLVDQMYTMCQKTAAAGQQRLLDHLQKEKVIGKFLNEYFGKASPDASHALNAISGVLNEAVGSNDHNIVWLRDQLQYTIEITLFKGMVHLLEQSYQKTAPADRQPPEKLFVTAFKSIIEVGNQHLPGIYEKIQQLPPKERQAAAEKALQPFVNEMIKMLFGSLDEHMPIPEKWRPTISGIVMKYAHSFVAEAFVSSTAWVGDIKQDRKALGELFHSDNPIRLCHLVGQVAGAGIASTMRKDKEMHASSVIALAQPYLGGETTDNMRTALTEVFQYIGDNETSKTMKPLYGFVNVYIESMVLKFLTSVSKDLQAQDAARNPQSPSLIEDMSIQFLGRLTEHFSAIGAAKPELEKMDEKERGYFRVMRRHKKTPEHLQRERQVLVRHFDERHILHEATIGPSQQLAMGERVSEDVFKLLGITEKSPLPLPPLFREPLWTKLIQEKVAPQLMVTLLATISDEKKLNSIILSLLAQVEKAGKKPKRRPEDEPPRPWKGDDFQKKLNGEFSNLVEAVVTMEKRSMLAPFIKNKTIRRQIGEVLGEATRDQMRQNTKPLPVIDAFNLLMGTINDAMHGVTYDSKTDSFQYQKTTSEGVKETVSEPDFSGIFPKTPEQAEALAKKEREDLKKIREVIPKQLGNVLDDVAQRTIKDIYDVLWNRWKTKINEGVEKHFAKYSQKTRDNIRKIFTGLAWIASLFVWAANKILYIFYILIFKHITTTRYFNYIADVRSEDLRLKIHDNLVYAIADDTIGMLKKGNLV